MKHNRCYNSMYEQYFVLLQSPKRSTMLNKLNATILVLTVVTVSACSQEPLDNGSLTPSNATIHEKPIVDGSNATATLKPVDLTLAKPIVKEGLKFLEQAESLIAAQVLLEAPDNFYEKIRKCKLSPEANICPDFMRAVERVVEIHNTERPKQDLNLILRQATFFMGLDEAEIRENYMVTTTPVGEPRLIEKPSDKVPETKQE
jgi:hypothetical protein